MTNYLLPDGGYLTVCRACGGRWFVTASFTTSATFQRLAALRDARGGRNGFASEAEADSCARDFVAVETARETRAA